VKKKHLLQLLKQIESVDRIWDHENLTMTYQISVGGEKTFPWDDIEYAAKNAIALLKEQGDWY
jgi:hypothetical protein